MTGHRYGTQFVLNFKDPTDESHLVAWLTQPGPYPGQAGPRPISLVAVAFQDAATLAPG